MCHKFPDGNGFGYRRYFAVHCVALLCPALFGRSRPALPRGLQRSGFFCTQLFQHCSISFSSSFKQLQQTSEIQEKLLQDRSRQIEELESVWEIQESEITDARKIDEGAFGEVFVAKWRDVDVAVKRIRSGVSELNEDAETEFHHEISFMRMLRHANLVLFFGCGRGGDGLPFLVCEFLPRGSLKHILRDEEVELLPQRKLLFARGLSFCRD
jgi:hypothetical protein